MSYLIFLILHHTYSRQTCKETGFFCCFYVSVEHMAKDLFFVVFFLVCVQYKIISSLFLFFWF